MGNVKRSIVNMKVLVPVFILSLVGFCAAEESTTTDMPTTMSCYVCNSETDVWCADSVNLNAAGDKAIQPCSTSCSYVFGEKNGEDVHIRDCEDEPNFLKEDGCVKINNEDHKDEDAINVRKCWCSTYLCNSAQRFGFSSIFGAVSIFVLIIFG